MDYLSQTGLDALKGADILRTAPDMYQSTVEYAASPIGRKMRDIAQTHLANFGTRVFYTQHASFDTHASQLGAHAQLWKEVSAAVYDFYQDLREHNARTTWWSSCSASSVAEYMTTAPGPTMERAGGLRSGRPGGSGLPRRVPIQESRGPAIRRPGAEHRLPGCVLNAAEDWLGLDPNPIVGGNFERLDYIAK